MNFQEWIATPEGQQAKDLIRRNAALAAYRPEAREEILSNVMEAVWLFGYREGLKDRTSSGCENIEYAVMAVARP